MCLPWKVCFLVFSGVSQPVFTGRSGIWVMDAAKHATAKIQRNIGLFKEGKPTSGMIRILCLLYVNLFLRRGIKAFSNLLLLFPHKSYGKDSKLRSC